MKRIVTIVLLLLPYLAHGQEAIGHWRDCLDYSAVYHIAPAGDRIYGSSLGGLYYFNLFDGTAVPMGKATGLSDVGVTTIAYDNSTKSLVVAYTNSNIDILCDDNIYNLSDLKRSDVAGNKNINHIRFHNGKAWLATGLGIVVVDLTRHEISETYYIGTEGAHIAVYDIAFTADSIYAATAEGLKSLATGERYPGISDRWRTDSRLNGLSITTLDTLGGSLLLATYSADPEQTTCYRSTQSDYIPWASGTIRSLHIGDQMAALSYPDYVVRYDKNLQPVDTLREFLWGPVRVHDAVTDNGIVWMGHEWGGIIGLHGDNVYGSMPPGPFSADNCYRLMSTKGRMMLCPGGHTSTFTNAWLQPNLLTASGLSWRTLNLSNGALDGLHDLLSATVNPKDTNEIIALLWGHGVASIKDNEVKEFYNSDNTPALHPYQMSSGYSTLLTGDAVFDRYGDLWVLNALSRYGLAVRRTDGEWESLSTEALSSTLSVDKIIYDSINNWLWFCGRENAIYVHDRESRMARIDPNFGSKLQTESVNTIVQDRTGNIWIGTNKGIKVIYNTYDAFKNGGRGETAPVSCSNITITNGSFAEYLMAYENITSIAVDGANRKWVGTSTGGLYLISANGMEQLEHFTSTDSPLFSDKIVCLAVQSSSGEVYIGTDRGLQVYRGTATYAETLPEEHIYAFPNPVRPDYDGPVAIKGFTRDALVHITDAGGHVVYSTQAHGGQAVWNTRTSSGTPVASGVYYVFASDAEGGNRSVTKILIVR